MEEGRKEGKWLKTICGGAKSNGIMRGNHSSFGAGKERQAAPSRETIWRKIDFQTGLPPETQGTSKRRPWSSWPGRGRSRTNFLSLSFVLFHSNLLHKSRDIGKRVSRFLCNEFAVERERRRAVKAAAVDGRGREPG